jgi:hypothetical protein
MFDKNALLHQYQAFPAAALPATNRDKRLPQLASNLE